MSSAIECLSADTDPEIQKKILLTTTYFPKIRNI